MTLPPAHPNHQVSGSVLVESALAFILVFTIVLVGLQLGLHFMDRSVANVSAFFAAREYAITGDPSAALTAAQQQWTDRGKDPSGLDIAVTVESSAAIGDQCVIDLEIARPTLNIPLVREALAALVDPNGLTVTIRSRARAVLEPDVIPL